MNENLETIIGVDNQFIDVLEQTSALAQLKKPVLIIGERGTGKELIAHRLHYLAPWWQGPFISINCSALNDNLLDSELLVMKRELLQVLKIVIKGVLNERMEALFFLMSWQQHQCLYKKNYCVLLSMVI